jgi:integrase
MRVISWKGKKTTVRHVPIFDQVFDLLTNLPKHGEYVFSHHDGRPLSRMGVVHSSFMRLVDRLEIKDFVFHDLRHTFASDFLSKGGTLTELAKIMGHSATTMTERYGHLSQEHLTGAIKILSREKCYEFATVENGPKNGSKRYDFATVGKNQSGRFSKVVDNQQTPR